MGTRLDCNLTNAGVDMVVAISQLALNSEMLKLMNESTYTNQRVAFQKNKDGSYAVIDYNTLVGQLGMDLFNISNPSDLSDDEQEAVNKAYLTLKIDAVFKITAGVPVGVPPSKLPDAIELQPSSSKDIENVHFNVFFKDFEILYLDFDRDLGGVTLTKYKQVPTKEIWKFSTNVKLSLSSKAFNELPKNVQDELKARYPDGSIDIDKMLEIKQLALILSNAKLSSSPNIDGVSNPKLTYIFNVYFYQVYWDYLQQNGGNILGYTTTTKVSQQPTGTPLFKMQDVDFFITGNISDPNSLFLNYVFVEKGHAFDYSKYQYNVNWTWINPDELGRIHGIMAVNEHIFEGFLSAPFNKVFETIKRGITVTRTGPIQMSLSPCNTDYRVDITPYAYDCIKWRKHSPSSPEYSYEINGAPQQHRDTMCSLTSAIVIDLYNDVYYRADIFYEYGKNIIKLFIIGENFLVFDDHHERKYVSMDNQYTADVVLERFYKVEFNSEGVLILDEYKPNQSELISLSERMKGRTPDETFLKRINNIPATQADEHCCAAAVANDSIIDQIMFNCAEFFRNQTLVNTYNGFVAKIQNDMNQTYIESFKMMNCGVYVPGSGVFSFENAALLRSGDMLLELHYVNK